MHPTLQRQINRALGNLNSIPKTPGWENLFKLIGETYTHYDEDRLLIERSLEISSKEMNQKNKELLDQIKEVKEQAAEISQLNGMMINRELKMIKLKQEITTLKQQLGQVHEDLRPTP